MRAKSLEAAKNIKTKKLTGIRETAGHKLCIVQTLDLAGDHVLSQEGVPQTDESVHEVSRNTEIRQLSSQSHRP